MDNPTAEHESEVAHGRLGPGSQAENDSGRNETEPERIDRNLSELLQELRVAGIGVQVLFGFLLSLPFTTRFDTLSDREETLYLADVLLAALSIALLTGPVAYHRIRFRQHAKASVLRASNTMAISGLGAGALSVSGAVLLVVSVVRDGIVVWLIGAATFLVFGLLWFVFPAIPRGKDVY
jgi:Family of unknown function (DUF6328)